MKKIGENFINKKNVALILEDNVFYGQGLTKVLTEKAKMKSGSCIFGYQVKNPENYSIIEIKNKKILSITEKPKKPMSNVAITSLYFHEFRKLLQIIDIMPIIYNSDQIDSVNSNIFFRCITNEIPMVIPKNINNIKKFLTFNSFLESESIDDCINQ